MIIKTLSLILIVFFSIYGVAADFSVNTTDDLIDLSPGDGICEATLSFNNCSLRAAIMETNVLSSDDIINLPAGVFVLDIVGGDSAARVGDLDVIFQNLTIQGVSRDESIIDGGGIDRIFDFVGSTVTLERLTLRNGGDDSATVLGGAIYTAGNGSEALNIIDVKFENNRANAGGAIFASNMNLDIFQSIFTNNSTTPLGVTNNYGPAIFCASCYLKIDSSSVYYNHIGAQAIRVEQGTLVMLNSTVSNNDEGGIRTVNADAIIKFSTIVENGVSKNLSHFSFDDTEFLQIGNSVIQTSTNINCQAGDLPVSLGNNVVNDDSCNFLMSGDMQNTDAELDGLKNNGGNTLTHRPTVASVLIDQINTVDCVGIFGNPLFLDQRGTHRQNGSLCDIGAVELDGDIIFFNGFE